jgi:hypothetical protein
MHFSKEDFGEGRDAISYPEATPLLLISSNPQHRATEEISRNESPGDLGFNPAQPPVLRGV